MLDLIFSQRTSKFLGISGFVDFLVGLARLLLLFPEDQLVPELEPSQQSSVRSVVREELKTINFG